MTDPTRRTIVEIRDLDFRYPGERPLFTALTADIRAGVTFVEGDTGSGKTTLLKLLAGELRGGGRIEPDVRDVAWFDAHNPAFDAMAAAELLADQSARHGPADAAAFAGHLAGFALTPHAAKPMFMLSTGSRRKVGLAVALSLAPALTLLDEPCAGLDAGSLDYLSGALAGLAGSPHRAIVLAGAYGLGEVPGAAVLRLGAD